MAILAEVNKGWCRKLETSHYIQPATPSHRNVIVLSLCTPSNTHHDVSGGCVVGFHPVPAFPRAAFVLVICLMSPSHQSHRNIWREDNTLKASCSSLIAHRSVPTISHLSPYHISFIAKAWRPLDSWEKCPKSSPTWAMSVNLQLPPEAALFRKQLILFSLHPLMAESSQTLLTRPLTSSATTPACKTDSMTPVTK